MAAAATGRLSQNTHGQPKRSTTQPPAAGPMAMKTSGRPT
jgi:hypothetical protein